MASSFGRGVQPCGVIAIADPIKATARAALDALKADGIRIIMLTGDNQTTAEAVARQLGVEDVRADVLPDDKHRIVGELKARGRIVAMAGDGVNDAPALAEADVGIAMGTGTEVAIQSAGVTPCAATSPASCAPGRSAGRSCATSGRTWCSPSPTMPSASQSRPACSTRRSASCSARSWPH